MKSTYQETETFNFETYVDVNFTYRAHLKRVEECHGLHEFDEDEEIDRNIEKVKLILSDGGEIDITSRLTQEELKQIIGDL
jgi:hypothetical protein